MASPPSSGPGVDAPAEFDSEKTRLERDKWTKQVLAARSHEYAQEDRIIVHVTTWNVAGTKPAEGFDDVLTACDEAPDIYAFGFQEIVDLNPGTVMLYDTDSAVEWQQHIRKDIVKKHGPDTYVQLHVGHLVGTAICIFVKAERQSQIKDLRGSTVGCGVLGTMGNKGGVGVRFDVNGLQLALITCHLNAGQEKVQRRNQDFKDIESRLDFGRFSLRSHDHIVWFGDLNYRIELEAGQLHQLMEVGEVVKGDDWVQLAKDRDQLLQSQGAGQAFVQYQEAALDFMPTYKYKQGTHDYDHKRAPAWTDRILWKSSKDRSERIKCLSYGRHELLASDHRPVTAIFQVDHEVIDFEHQEKILSTMMKQQDAWENNLIPQISVSEPELSFGKVSFLQPTEEQRVTITNDGQTLVAFEFMEKPGEDVVLQPWFVVEPMKGSLLPGMSMEVSVSVLVDQRSISLASSAPSLDDIAVLHLKNGRDYFLTLKATFTPSCFGHPLDALMHPSEEGQPALMVPAQIWRLVDALQGQLGDQTPLFLESGPDEEMVQIRNAIESSEDLAHFSSHSLAHTLILFLESLPEPIISEMVTQQLQIEPATSAVTEQRVLSMLCTSHYNVFIYIMSFLRVVLKHTPSSVLTAEDLALVFANAFTRQTPARGSATSSRSTNPMANGTVQFVLRFL